MKAFRILLKNEGKLSLRGMDMFIFAICMPVVVTVLIGILLGDKPAAEGSPYTFFEQSFGAISTIAICAGGVMGLPLLISDYRHRKILKRFQVTPAHPVLLLGVHAAIYALYSLASLVLITVISVLFFNFRLPGSWLSFLGAYLLVMFSMFSIGFLVGGLAPDSKTAGMIASLLYFPMLIFSGATLPYEIMPVGMQKAVDFMPLTQGIALLKTAALGVPFENAYMAAAVIIVIGVICTGLSISFFKWE